MSMPDLKTVQDHPAKILMAQHEVDYRTAADALRSYESDKRVTFAALDDEALIDLKHAVKDVAVFQQYGLGVDMGRVEALLSAVESLLGIDGTES